MSLEMYDVTVPVFRRTLKALIALMAKAEDHCRAQGLDARGLADARLAPDMHGLGFQIASVINNSVGAVARLRGLPAPRAEAFDSLGAMSRAMAEAVENLGELAPADLDGSQGREVVLPHAKGDRHFSGQGYLLSLALPNFFFHAATAYDILRNQGVEIGKRDFLGELPPRRPPRPALQG